MVNKYQNFHVIEDDRSFIFGEIWKVRDELVSLLPTDRVNVNRTIHPCRLVVVTQSCMENSNKFFPIIRVAPLASDIRYKQKFDIELQKGIDATGIDKTCMIQMQLEQPMLKKDLYEKIGEISEDKEYEVTVIQSELIGLDLGQDDNKVYFIALQEKKV